MSPALLPLTVILATAIHFPAIWCQQTQPYDECGKSIQCGSPPLYYPFWGLGRPAICGRSGFEVTCRHNAPTLLYGALSYRVLHIDNPSQRITVARNDLWGNSCPRYLYNTTYNTTLFDGNGFDEVNLSLYYGCNSSLPVPLTSNYQFNCDMYGPDSDNYFFTTSMIVDNVLDYLERCNSSFTVPVNQYWAAQMSSANVSRYDLRSALTAGFSLQWRADNDECDRCNQSGGRCGSNSTSPELFACYCTNGNFSLTCNSTRSEGNGGSNGTSHKLNWKLKLVIDLSCGIAGTMLLLFVILYRKKRLWRNRKAKNHQIEIFIRNHGTLAPKRYKYSEIKKMTNSFLLKLGQGGYGSVYKGQLPDGRLVAVKLLDGAKGDGEDFINEIASIGRTSHVNIVTLLGFCFEGKRRALMYEFMPNGSLDKFLRSDDSRLDWNTLFQIAKGIARGLEYLHRGCNTRIVHFDIKPHNILLDEEFVPKVSDFGLSKLCKKKESIVSVMGARGTIGYIAPEVFFKRLGGASHKSDVYSYGMMVLEMISPGKNNNAMATSRSEACFPNCIYKQVEDGENLGVYGVTTEEEENLARKMMMVSLWCIQSDPSDRPSISEVVEMLEGSLQSLQFPPRRFWSSSTRLPQGSSPSAVQSSTKERCTHDNVRLS